MALLSAPPFTGSRPNHVHVIVVIFIYQQAVNQLNKQTKVLGLNIKSNYIVCGIETVML